MTLNNVFTKTSLLEMLMWLQEARTGHTVKCGARNVRTYTEARRVPAAPRGGRTLECLQPAGGGGQGWRDTFAWLSLLPVHVLLAGVCM